MNNQTANIKVDTKLSKEVKNTTWCFTKMCIGRNHLESTDNTQYADDTILIVETIEDLQSLIDQVVTSIEESELTLNIKIRTNL